MKLNNYIKETLISIGKGLTEANELYDPPAPFSLLGGDEGTIDFEVILLVEEHDDVKIEGDVSSKLLSFIKVAANGKLEREQKNINKQIVRFKIKPAERQFYKMVDEKNENN